MNTRIPQLEKFLEKTPNDPFLNHALALEWIKDGQDPRAMWIFKEAREKRPEYVATYYHLGKLLQRMGDEQEALKIFEEGMAAAKAAGDNHSFSELRGAYDELAY